MGVEHDLVSGHGIRGDHMGDRDMRRRIPCYSEHHQDPPHDQRKAFEQNHRPMTIAILIGVAYLVYKEFTRNKTSDDQS